MSTRSTWLNKCLRCPDHEAADKCSARGTDASSLLKCDASGADSSLWWGFTDGHGASLPDFLTDPGVCQQLLDFVAQQNSGLVDQAVVPKKKAQRIKNDVLSKKAELNFRETSITKQMLELALRTVKSPEDAFNLKKLGNELPAGSSSKAPASIPDWKAPNPPTYKELIADNPPLKASQSSASFEVLNDTAASSRIGAGGKPTRVIANYVHVTALPKMVYEYNLEFGHIVNGSAANGSNTNTSSNVPINTSQKKLVFKSLEGPHGFLAGRRDWATDYKTFWSLAPLGSASVFAQHREGPVNFDKLSGKTSVLSEVRFSPVRPTPLDLTLGGKLSPAKLMMDIDDNGASVRVTAINGLLSHVASKSGHVISTGANKFFSKTDHHNMTGIQAHRGYFTSIRPGTESVLLNIGTMTSTFYKPLKVSNFQDMCYNNEAKLKDYGHSWQDQSRRLLAGKEIRILYDRAQHDATYDPNAEKNRHRIIADLGSEPQYQNTNHDDNTTVQDYFQNETNAPPLSDIHLTVNVGVKDKGDTATRNKQVYLPAEFVALVADQRFARHLADLHMSELSDFSLKGPAFTKEKIINDGFRLLGFNDPTQPFHHLGIKLTPQLISIPARMANPPAIRYREPGVQSNKTAKVVNASWNLEASHFISPGITSSGVHLLDFRPGGSAPALTGTQMANVLRLYGMTVAGTTSHWRPNGNPSESDLRIDLKAHYTSNNRPSLHLVILQKHDKPRYGLIKRIYDQHVGAHTVCITAPKTSKQDRQRDQLLANLALKFNAKCRGTNHEILQVAQNQQTPAFSSIASDTMVVGADVSHAPSTMDNCPSVAAVVASDDATFAHFPGSMRLQASKQEFLQDLAGMMKERLLRYCVTHAKKTLPQNIIFYRDGVGEDMYEHVVRNEIPAVEEAFAYIRNHAADLIKQKKLTSSFIDHGKDLKLTFIVVGKRHNTRFFPTNAADQHTTGNVKPGLIVDRVITRPAVDDTVDFFLQSHAAIKGTARSAHYVILRRGAFSVEKIQSLTHSMCYNFTRATKGVSYAAPAYYADRLADRGTLYLKGYTGTDGRDQHGHGIKMTKEEENITPRKDGLRAYERRIAEIIQGSKDWNPNLDAVDLGAIGKRVNPWHPDLDNVMFWI